MMELGGSKQTEKLYLGPCHGSACPGSGPSSQAPNDVADRAVTRLSHLGSRRTDSFGGVKPCIDSSSPEMHPTVLSWPLHFNDHVAGRD